MFDKILNNIPKYFNRRTFGYSASTAIVLYILFQLPPRPTNNKYLMRKY